MEWSRLEQQIHEDTYREFGFELVYIEPGCLADRVARISAMAAEFCTLPVH